MLMVKKLKVVSWINFICPETYWSKFDICGGSLTLALRKIPRFSRIRAFPQISTPENSAKFRYFTQC